MRSAVRLCIMSALATVSGAAVAQGSGKPLFSSGEPIHIVIQGPVGAIARRAADDVTPRPATLSVAGTSDSLPIQLSARGLSRRTGGICTFPPLRVEFPQPPGAGSLFAGKSG